MSELVRFTVRDKGSVIFEIDEAEHGIRQVGRQDGKVRDLHLAFEQRLADIHDAAGTALAILRDHLEPDEVRLKFGIKMTAEAGAVVARSAIEGNIGVEMSWQRDSSHPAAAIPDQAP